MTKKQSRRRVHKLQVPVLPAEAIEIKSNAADCGLAVAAYLRNVGLQYKPRQQKHIPLLNEDAVFCNLFSKKDFC